MKNMLTYRQIVKRIVEELRAGKAVDISEDGTRVAIERVEAEEGWTHKLVLRAQFDRSNHLDGGREGHLDRPGEKMRANFGRYIKRAVNEYWP